jgi:uncharacterized membrane protein YfcA
LAGVIFFTAHMVSAVSGFGSNVLGLPLLALIVGVEAGKQSLVVLSSVMYVYLTIRWWHRVDKRELIRMALICGVGLVVGILVYERIPRRQSTMVLAIFVIVVGVRGLLNIAPEWKSPMWVARVMLFLGGVVHGAFTTGGPLMTVYARRVMHHKSVFRATAGVIWLLLAVGLMIAWSINHSWNAATPRVSIMGFPFLLGGLVAGEYLHHRVEEKAFNAAVNATLTAVGVVLLVSLMR